MFNCTTDNYTSLYQRWIDRKDGLLQFAALQPGEAVLDLCGGTGVLSRQALEMGASRVVLRDLNPRCHLLSPCFEARRASAEELQGESQFDVVACRQSIGYLNLKKVFPRVARILRPGGRFVFNTFDHPRWGWHTYTYNGHRFVEASGYVGRRVFHMQLRILDGVDFTLFQWHPIPELIHELEHHFSHITTARKGSSWKIVAKVP